MNKEDFMPFSFLTTKPLDFQGLIRPPTLWEATLEAAGRLRQKPLPLYEEVLWTGYKQAQTLLSRIQTGQPAHAPLHKTRPPKKLGLLNPPDNLEAQDFLNQQPLAWRTHPYYKPLADYLRAGDWTKARHYLEAEVHWPSYLIPLLTDTSHFIAPRLNPPSQAVVTLTQPEEPKSPEQIFPVSMFMGVNSRGMAGYDFLFFGKRTPYRTPLSETLMGELLARLPNHAVIADWGGGLGLFAYQAHLFRPDLVPYVVDLHSPEAIHQNSAKSIQPATLRDHVHYLTGDGTTIQLDQPANLIVSATLTLYIEDPLALLAHLYNQLHVGGLLMITMHRDIIDLNKPWDKAHFSGWDILTNLEQLEIPARSTFGGRTLVIQRMDDRQLVTTASLRAATLHQFQSLNKIHGYSSFYQPNSSNTPWVTLMPSSPEKTHAPHRSSVQRKWGLSQGLKSTAWRLLTRR